MKVPKFISRVFRGAKNIINRRTCLFGNWMEQKMNFSNLIFLNICDLLTDLTNDVDFFPKERSNNNAILFAEFKFFFENWGQICLNKIFTDGFIVIGHDVKGFRILTPNEYRIQSSGEVNIVIPTVEDVEIYVMQSRTYIQQQISDRQILKPFMELLDNVLNGSNTISARLGAVVIATPEQPNDNPVAETLSEEDRKDLEEQVSKDYGTLSHQRQIMFLNRPIKTNVISLSKADERTVEKVKLSILAIADRIKVPANQIAIIDALGSKSFANGSELREGDFFKYQSFERLLQSTFIPFASAMGLSVDYTIYNKPQRMAEPFTQTQTAL